jgi:hypothetical protein
MNTDCFQLVFHDLRDGYTVAVGIDDKIDSEPIRVSRLSKKFFCLLDIGIVVFIRPIIIFEFVE